MKRLDECNTLLGQNGWQSETAKPLQPFRGKTLSYRGMGSLLIYLPKMEMWNDVRLLQYNQ